MRTDAGARAAIRESEIELDRIRSIRIRDQLLSSSEVLRLPLRKFPRYFAPLPHRASARRSRTCVADQRFVPFVERKQVGVDFDFGYAGAPELRSVSRSHIGAIVIFETGRHEEAGDLLLER